MTKGNFTCDERNNLVHLFNMSHFSSTCCTQNSSLISCTKTMAKRMQEQKEEIIVAKSEPMATNLSSHVPASSSNAKIPIASESPGILRVSGKPDARERRNSKTDAAWSSQGRLQDAYPCGLMDRVAGKPGAPDKSQESWEFLESESWNFHEEEVTGRLVLLTKQSQGNLEHPANQKTRGILKLEEKNEHTINTCLQPQFIMR